MKIQQLKTEIAEIATRHSQADYKWSNLSNKEKAGLKSLQRRVRESEIVCTVTDKSGRWTCDTPENYKNGCKKLVEDQSKTPEINMEQHNIAEKELNSHALAFTRMLGLSDEAEGDRMRWAVTAEGSAIAPLYGLRKDHKPISEVEEERIAGPKMRPICGAHDSLTKRTSYLLSKLLTPLIDGDTHCASTDELVKEIDILNGKDVKKEWVVGSLDVEV